MDTIDKFYLLCALYDDNIHDVDIKSATEIGPKTGASHAHIMFNFKHNTLVKLDYNKIKSKLKEDLKLEGLYLNNKTYNASEANLEDFFC